ncbi:uncharacterized protein LOC132556894 [Ylistrum balloti]|uniref:uncharacterized protein LOC132556894 n=1 Tax=Ylistrum balloti TaxID=509963 RepID=UPI002905A72A|nr:uncharacterized protein LOC132556894 [Ylistrum balloti]
MEDEYKILTVLVILAVTAVHKTESPDQTRERYTRDHVSSTSALSISSPATIPSLKTASSPPASISTSTLSKVSHSTKMSPNISDETTTRSSVTKTFLSSTSASSSESYSQESSSAAISRIIAGVVSSLIVVILLVAAVFYFKRRQRQKSAVEDLKVNYESEKFEDITDTDYDVIAISSSNYDKLENADVGENQYTMIVRGTGGNEIPEEDVVSLDDSSSYVLPNDFGIVSSVRAKVNGVTNKYENTMFSVDIKDDFAPIKDDDDYIQFSEGNDQIPHKTS